MKRKLLQLFNKTLLIISLLSFTASLSFAQMPVSGTVKDVKNEPIPGVSVLVKGTGTGTVTDQNGDFKITANSKESILVFLQLVLLQRKSKLETKARFQ